MKVFENIERFHRKIEADSMNKVSDQEFKQGLEELIRAIVPLRRNQMECISQYQKIRDELPLTKLIAEKESYFNSFDLGRREVDLAVLKVIYEDRYAFGYLYWHLMLQYDGKPEVDVYDSKDPEAPYKKELIEYAIDFDLEETEKDFQSISSTDARYNYLKHDLLKSEQRILVEHPIKERYESAIRKLMETCLKEYEVLDFYRNTTISEDDTVSEGSSSSTQAGTQVQNTEETFSPTKNKPNTPNRADSKFACNYVLSKVNRKWLMEFLHDHIDDKEGQNALIALQAAIDAELLMKPTYPAFNNEFDVSSCSKQTYSDHIGRAGQGIFPDMSEDLERLITELKEECEKLREEREKLKEECK